MLFRSNRSEVPITIKFSEEVNKKSFPHVKQVKFVPSKITIPAKAKRTVIVNQRFSSVDESVLTSQFNVELLALSQTRQTLLKIRGK